MDPQSAKLMDLDLYIARFVAQLFPAQKRFWTIRSVPDPSWLRRVMLPKRWKAKQTAEDELNIRYHRTQNLPALTLWSPLQLLSKPKQKLTRQGYRLLILRISCMF